MAHGRILSFLAVGAAVAVTGLGSAPASAWGGKVLVRSAEQDAAYRGVNSGRMLSLEQVRSIVTRRVKGEYMGVEIDDGMLQDGGYMYRLTYRQPNGAIVRVDVNAQNGRILGIHGK